MSSQRASASLPDRSRSAVDRFVSTVDDLPVAGNFLAGVATFIWAYAAFVAVVAISGSPNWSAPVTTLKQLGTLFFNAQNVPLVRYREIVIGDQTVTQEASVNLLQAAPTSLPRLVYYLIPVFVLAVVAGALSWRYVDTDDPIATGGAVVGGLTLGYVLAAMAGAVVVAQRTTLENAVATLSPDLLWTLALGIAYPLVVGTLVVGTAVAWRRRSELIAAARNQA